MNSDNYGPEEAARESMENATVLSGLSLFCNTARGFPPLQYEEQQPLFEVIKNEPDSEAAAANIRRIAEAYLNFSIAHVYKSNLRKAFVELDDLIGAACLGLMEAIHLFARVEEQTSFSEYLSTVLHSHLVYEFFNSRYSITHSNQRIELSKYIRAKKELINAAPESEPIDLLYKIANTMGRSIVDVLAMEEALKRPSRLYEGTEERLVAAPLVPAWEDPLQLACMERAVSLLPKAQQETLKSAYGLSDAPQSKQVDLAEERGITGQSVHNATYRARSALRAIIPQLRDGTFDFLEWRLSHVRCRTPLIMAGIVGVKMDLHRSIAELGTQALEVLRAQEQPHVAEQLNLLYGLESGQPITGREVARRAGCKGDAIWRNERFFLQRWKQIRDERLRKSQEADG